MREDHIRVLHLINSLGPGGAERSLTEMLGRISSWGIESLVATLSAAEHGAEEAVRLHGVPVTVIGGTGWGRIRQVRKHILQTRPDILHTTIFEADVMGRMAARHLDVAVLSSLVNTSYDPVRRRDPHVGRVKLRAARMVDGWTARRFGDHFHAITQAVKRAAVRDLHIPPDRITVVERGRDGDRLPAVTAKRRAAARRAFGIDPGSEVLVSVGRQEFQKGQAHLVQAMGEIVTVRPRAVLLIAGRTGAATPDLRRLVAASGLGTRVRFLGHRDDVPEILAAADVFVFPSVYEGLGGVVIEAMAMALPVVASDVEALREVVEHDHSGTLVPPGSSLDLARACIHLLASRNERSRLGQRGREIFEERFTLDRSVERMAALYRRLAGPRGRGG